MIKKFTTGFALSASTLLFSQVGIGTPTPQATLDVTGTPANTAKLDGIIAPRLTGAQLRGKTYTTAQTGALVYVTDADTAPANQTLNVTASGYYYFNGTRWIATTATDINIYSSDGTLSNNRTVTQNGNSLTIKGNVSESLFGINGGFWLYGTGGSKRSNLELIANDNNLNSVNSRLSIFVDPENTASINVLNDATALALGTTQTTNSAPINFMTSSGSGALGITRMKITGEGNVAVNISSPTEKLDVNGNIRLRSLPLNGSTNAIFTNPGGSTASPTQNQTFTATRTIVADANGVLGYASGLPTDAGTQKVLVNANVPGTQNINGGTNLIGQFNVENIDVLNAWTNNVFTVPNGAGGLYTINMQTSNSHVAPDSISSWFVMAYFQKSTDGGANWNIILRDTRSNMSNTIVDNGNALLWTGNLNAGDMIRPMFLCTAVTNNTVIFGSLSIIRILQ